MIAYLGGRRFLVDGKEISHSAYFYVLSRERPEALGGVKLERTDLKAYVFKEIKFAESDLRVWRAYVGDPAKVPKAREAYLSRGYRVSQSAIPFVARFAVDYRKDKQRAKLLPEYAKREIAEALRSAKRPSFAAFDVEVQNGAVLVGWTFDGVEISTGSPSEFVADLSSSGVDYAVGFNSWSFDWEYVSSSKLSIAGVPHLDLFPFTAGAFRTSFGVQEEANALHEIVRQVKLSLPFDYKRWIGLKARRGAGALEEYLKYDVVATYKLAEKVLLTAEALAKLTGVPLHLLNVFADGYSPGSLHEALVAKYLEASEGAVVEDRRASADYGGAEKARASATGLFRDVYEYDFNMLYPTIYYVLQLDPLTIKKCSSGLEIKRLRVKICTSPGPVSEYLSSLYEARAETKKMKKELGEVGEAADQAVKILANSAYGVFSKSFGNLVNEYIAAVIFWTSQEIFDKLWGRFKPLYGDTDSLYLRNNPGEDAVNSEARRVAAEVLGESAINHVEAFSLKLEGKWNVYIPADEDGRPLLKNYVKWSGEEKVLKGVRFKPHSLPLGIKYGGWADVVVDIIEGRRSLEEIVASLRDEELFLEESMSARDVFRTNSGPLKVVDFKRAVLLGRLALDRGGRVEVERAPGGVRINGVFTSDILDALYIPVSRSTKAPVLIYYTGGRIRKASVFVSASLGNGAVEKIVAEAREMEAPSGREVEQQLLKIIDVPLPRGARKAPAQTLL
jgi:DNA polymerase I